MPAKETPKTALHTRLLEGFEHKSRADGTVHTIKANGKVVAEVCVGKKATRMNLKSSPSAKVAKGLTLGGHSASWPGGGVVVTEANVAAARALLVALTSAPATAPTASDAAKVSSGAQSAAKTARKRTTRRSSAKAAAA